MKFIDRYYKVILFSIPLISLLLHFHVLNQDLIGIHVWRQTETQTVIDNFYRESMNILNPHVNTPADTDRIFRMEFPLMQWLFAAFYRIFGSHILISRLLSFIIGLVSVYGMYRLCYNLSGNRTMATLCAWCFNFSPVFYYYTINPLPDNMALCFGIWSIAWFSDHIKSHSLRSIVFSSIFLCLATLIKLPFVLYGAFAAAYVIQALVSKRISVKRMITIAIIFIAGTIPPIIWYGTVIPQWNNGITKGVLDATQKPSELISIFSTTLVSILPELLINYGSVLFFIAGVFGIFKYKLYSRQYFPLLLTLLLAVVFYYFFEINMITTVHDYYLFPFLPLIFMVTAYGAYRLIATGNRRLVMLCFICLALLPLTAFLRADSRWDEKDPGFNHTYYDHKDEIRALIPGNAYCVIGNDVSQYILPYYVDRKGWTYSNDELTGAQLSYYITKGAKYLFLDSRIDEKKEIRQYLAEKLFDKGTLRIYKLK